MNFKGVNERDYRGVSNDYSRTKNSLFKNSVVVMAAAGVVIGLSTAFVAGVDFFCGNKQATPQNGGRPGGHRR